MHSQGLQVQGAAVYSYIPPQYHLLAATLLLLAGSACTAHFCMYALFSCLQSPRVSVPWLYCTTAMWACYLSGT